MKFLCLWATVAFILMALNADCQSSTISVAPLNQHPAEKALLFSDLPEKISCPANALQNIFAATVNNNLSISLGSSLKIEGTVIAKVAVSADQVSINIRCTNYKNALLNISKLTNADGSLSYIGRIVSPKHGDVLLLWEENGQYTFIRQKQLLAMVE